MPERQQVGQLVANDIASPFPQRKTTTAPRKMMIPLQKLFKELE